MVRGGGRKVRASRKANGIQNDHLVCTREKFLNEQLVPDGRFIEFLVLLLPFDVPPVVREAETGVNMNGESSAVWFVVGKGQKAAQSSISQRPLLI
uniref:Uncharacterized protein n=2 Tax=Anguilla anguilla TaxID=7936 RepID=A0A0E9XRP1_ANGAN